MSFKRSINTLVQHSLPGHLLSRAVGQLAFSEIPKIKNFLISQFIRRFDIRMDEVAEPSFHAYANFNAFFTRALKNGIRPLAGDKDVASPVDGTILSGGTLTHDHKLTAKGHNFSLVELLGNEKYNNVYQGGQYLTIYLSPKDYHRVHCPIRSELKHMVHIPGRLFSVNESTTTSIPCVFARNERVVMHFKSQHGPFLVVLVGAMLVASIKTPFAGVITPPGRDITEWNYYQGPHHKFEQGDEIGRFQYGSTVIVITPNKMNGFDESMVSGRSINMGESLGRL